MVGPCTRVRHSFGTSSLGCLSTSMSQITLSGQCCLPVLVVGTLWCDGSLATRAEHLGLPLLWEPPADELTCMLTSSVQPTLICGLCMVPLRVSRLTLILKFYVVPCSLPFPGSGPTCALHPAGRVESLACCCPLALLLESDPPFAFFVSRAHVMSFPTGPCLSLLLVGSSWLFA